MFLLYCLHFVRLHCNCARQQLYVSEMTLRPCVLEADLGKEGIFEIWKNITSLSHLGNLPEEYPILTSSQIVYNGYL